MSISLAALGIFPINPPSEIQHQFVKDALQEHSIAKATTLLFDGCTRRFRVPVPFCR
jgi:hypothetical protein